MQSGGTIPVERAVTPTTLRVCGRRGAKSHQSGTVERHLHLRSRSYQERVPPKRGLHRPAAAKAAPRAAGRRARAGVLRRPGRRERGPEPAKPPLLQFEDGEEVEPLSIPIDRWKKGEILVFPRAVYFGKEVGVAGRFRDLKVQDGQVTKVKTRQVCWFPCAHLSIGSSPDRFRHNRSVPS